MYAMKNALWVAAVFLLVLCPVLFVLPALGSEREGVSFLQVHVYGHDRETLRPAALISLVAGVVALTLAIRCPNRRRAGAN